MARNSATSAHDDYLTKLKARETVNIDPKLIVVDSGLRQHTDDEVYEFARSLIGINRIFQAVQVKLGEDDTLILVHGLKRHAAALLLNYESIPVVLCTDTGNAQVEAVSVQEDQTPLTPLQQAEAYQRILAEAEVAGKPLKQKELASIRNKSPQTISDILKLNDLAPSIKDKVRNDHNFSRDTLLAIAKIAGEDDQVKAFDAYVKGGKMPSGKVLGKNRKTSFKLDLAAIASADSKSIADAFTKLDAEQKANFWKVIDALKGTNNMTD